MMKRATVAKYSKLIGCIVCLGVSFSLPKRGSGQESAAAPRERAGAPAAASQPAPFQEDWTTLRVQSTSLQMKQPVVSEKDDTPGTGFIRERYQVTWRPKDPFDLYVIRPRGKAPAPVILYLYSFPEDTDQFKNDLWCETAVSSGYAAVGFVGAVTGHRTRYRLGKEWFVSEMQEALGSTVHDVELVLDYIATRKDLDVSRVAMFGSGSGAAIAILASAADSRIRVLDLLGPWGDWPKWVSKTTVISNDERPKFAKAEFLAKVEPLEPVSWLPKVKAEAIRIQDVRGNRSMPDDAQEKLEAAAPDFALINQYGNGRAFLANQRPGNLFQWMKDRFKEGAQPRVAAEKSERIHFFPAVEMPAENWPNVGSVESGKASSAAKPKQAVEKEKPNE